MTGLDEAPLDVAARNRPERSHGLPSGPGAPSLDASELFDVVVEQREDEITRRLSSVPGNAAATVFQTQRWIRTWYATIGRSVGTPLLLTVLDHHTSALAAMLPLIVRDNGRPRTVEFVDQSVCDANAPILGPSAPTGAAHAQLMWKAIRRALVGTDLVQFTKMPAEIEGRVNPLTLLPSARVASLRGHALMIDASFETYIASLKGDLRKDLRKSWRIFRENPGTVFRRIENPDEAVSVLAALERQQGARLRAQGQPYRLDASEFSTFYRTITADGVADGSVVLTALMQHDDVVAALLGLARGTTYVMVRISVGEKRWPGSSLGRLVIVQTMQMLHAQGYRIFDFSIGDDLYKRRLGARGRPLFELSAALTARGLPRVAYDQAKQFLRRHPGLHALAHRIVQPSGRLAGKATGDDRG